MGGDVSKPLEHGPRDEHSRPATPHKQQQHARGHPALLLAQQPPTATTASSRPPVTNAKALLKAHRQRMAVMINANMIQGFSRQAAKLLKQRQQPPTAAKPQHDSIVTVHVVASSRGGICDDKSSGTNLHLSTVSHAELLAMLTSPSFNSSKADIAREVTARLASSTSTSTALLALASQPAAVEALAAMLGDQDCSVQMAALSALQEASTDHEITRMLLADSTLGVASTLVQLMQDSSNSSMQSAAAAIVDTMSKLPPGHTAMHPITANPIGNAVLAGLHTVLASPAVDSHVRHSAACSTARLVPDFVDERGPCYLWNEHNTHEPHPWPAVEAAIKQLVSEVRTQQQLELTTWEAANALHHLAHYPDYKELIGQEPGAISSLLNLMPTGASTAVGDKATDVLAALCTGSGANQQRVSNNANFLPRLRAALSTPGYRAHQLWSLMSALGDNNPVFAKLLARDEPCVAGLVSCLNTPQRQAYAELLGRIAVADNSSLGAISKQPGVEHALMNSLTAGRLLHQLRTWRAHEEASEAGQQQQR